MSHFHTLLRHLQLDPEGRQLMAGGASHRLPDVQTAQSQRGDTIRGGGKDA